MKADGRCVQSFLVFCLCSISLLMLGPPVRGSEAYPEPDVTKGIARTDTETLDGTG